MLLNIIRIVYLLVCAGAVLAFVTGVDRTAEPPGLIGRYQFVAFFVLLAITQLVVVADLVIRRKRIELISAIYIGLMVGLLLAWASVLALTPLMANWAYEDATKMLLVLMLPYICISILLQTKDDFRFIIPYVEFARELKGGKPLILDSSALIDGRISDVVETKILDSQIIVPQFILHEVQEIADSHDKVRRARGRRGLDVLSKLQNSPHADVLVYETKQGEQKERGVSADQRLVELAKELGGRIITSDFNLNKVASVQGVDVINLNDVANALKPRYIPGERLQIKVLKEGESPGQGVGYLDDGTMVVCEQANHLIGREIDVIVTSVLQSSAGRMIFGRQVHHSGASRGPAGGVPTGAGS